MADNVNVANDGATPDPIPVATDDDGTAHHPYVKLEWGADNTQTKVAAGVTALPIQDNGNTITVDGTVGISGTVTVDGSGATQPVSGTVSVTGVATAANQTTIIGHVDGIEGSVDGIEALLTTIDADTGNLAGILTAVQIIDNIVSGSEAQCDIVAALPAGDNNIGNVDIVTVPRATTVVDVSLASAATSAQLLAANTARIALTLTNTDANAVYVYFGTTATATKFTVKIPADGYYEMPQPIYTGRIDAIWASDGSGSLIGTELAA